MSCQLRIYQNERSQYPQSRDRGAQRQPTQGRVVRQVKERGRLALPGKGAAAAAVAEQRGERDRRHQRQREGRRHEKDAEVVIRQSGTRAQSRSTSQRKPADTTELGSVEECFAQHDTLCNLGVHLASPIYGERPKEGAFVARLTKRHHASREE